MDEATASLDHRNESEIMETLKTVEKDFVTISITHRRKSLVNCDKIYHLNNRN